MESSAAAPAANATGAPAASNGAKGPQTPATPTPKPSTGQPGVATRPEPAEESKGAGRSKLNGQFTSRDSGTQRTEEPAAEPPKDAYRFKRKLKVDGKEEDVDYSEEDLARYVQIGRTAQSRLGELSKAQRELADERAKFESYRKNPDAFLKEVGANLDEVAARHLAQRAQRGLMSPDEQELSDLRQKVQSYETQNQQREQERIQAEATQREEAAWKLKEPAFLSAIEKHQLPRDMQTLGYMAKVGEELENALGEDVDPEVVVSVANERLGKFAERYVLSLPPEALAAKLGKQRMGDLMKLQVDKWRASQAAVNPVPRVEESPPPEEPKTREYLTEADIKRRSREMWGGK